MSFSFGEAHAERAASVNAVGESSVHLYNKEGEERMGKQQVSAEK